MCIRINVHVFVFTSDSQASTDVVSHPSSAIGVDTELSLHTTPLISVIPEISQTVDARPSVKPLEILPTFDARVTVKPHVFVFNKELDRLLWDTSQRHRTNVHIYNYMRHTNVRVANIELVNVSFCPLVGSLKYKYLRFV